MGIKLLQVLLSVGLITALCAILYVVIRLVIAGIRIEQRRDEFSPPPSIQELVKNTFHPLPEKISYKEMEFTLNSTNSHALANKVIEVCDKYFRGENPENVFVRYNQQFGFAWWRLTQVKDDLELPVVYKGTVTVFITNKVWDTPLYTK